MLQWKLCCGSEFSSLLSPSSGPCLSSCHSALCYQSHSFPFHSSTVFLLPVLMSWAAAQGSLPASWGLPMCTELNTAVPAPIQSPHVTDLGNVTGEGGCRANLCLTAFSLPKAKVHSVCSCWYKIIAFAFLIAVGKG